LTTESEAFDKERERCHLPLILSILSHDRTLKLLDMEIIEGLETVEAVDEIVKGKVS
jgi:hypothetical protein